MTIKSWVFFFSFLIIVSAGSVLATRYFLEKNTQAFSVGSDDEALMKGGDQPIVQISKPEPIIYNSWQEYDPAHITCDKEVSNLGEGGSGFVKNCSAEFRWSKKRIALPDLSSFADVKDFDGERYAWVAQYENIIYVDIKGGNFAPMGGSSVDIFYVFDEQHKTLSKVFACDSYDCVQLAQPQGYLTAYAHRESDDQGVRIYRDSIYGGKVYSSLAVSIPKENNEWVLGADCRDSQCADGSDWITVLDQNNFVLRFDKRTGEPSEADSKVETKYVHVYLE